MVFLASGLTSATAQGPPAYGLSAEDRDAIAELLEARAQAVAQRDRAAFDATLGSSGDVFRERQLASFDALGSVPLAEYELNAAWDRFGNLARPRDRDRYGVAEAVAIPLTEERYRLAADESDVVEEIFFTFVKRDGVWGIESDTDLEDVGFLSARHLWDFGEVDVVHQGRFEVISRGPGVSDRVIELADDAYSLSLRYWSGPAPAEVVILVPGTVSELERSVQATFDLDDFIAFTVSFIDGSDGLFTGPRIVLGPQALGDESSAKAREIMAHELLHLVTRSSSGPFVPLWLEEGFADYTGNDASSARLDFLRSRIAAGIFDGRVPADYEFTTGDFDSIFASYLEGHSAVRFMAERWGLDAVNEFYLELGAKRAVPGTTSYNLDRAIQKAIGIGFRDFERRWAVSIS